MRLLLSIFVALSAQAAPASNGNFQFVIEPAGAKCVHLTYATITPGYPSRKLASIRFYYGAGASGSVNDSSSYFTSTVKVDSSGEMSLTPVKFCGLNPGHYNFKYGLVDTAGAVLEFMSDDEFNPDTNGTDVQ